MPDPRPTDWLPTPPKRALNIEEYVDDKGVTRYKLLTATTKVDDELKARIIKEMAEHGRLGTACRLNNVSMATIRKHIERDPVFGEGVAEAIEAYKDRLITHHQNLVFNGTTKTSYDKNGSVVAEEQIYPIRLIELELKKHDEGYRDKREVTMNVKGGVLVAPSQVSMDDWEKKFGAPDDPSIIDGEFHEVAEEGMGGETAAEE